MFFPPPLYGSFDGFKDMDFTMILLNNMSMYFTFNERLMYDALSKKSKEFFGLKTNILQKVVT
jgi:hypothetical protein